MWFPVNIWSKVSIWPYYIWFIVVNQFIKRWYVLNCIRSILCCISILIFVYSLRYATDCISFIIYLAIHDNILVHLLYKGCPPSCIDDHSQFCLFCLGHLVYWSRTPLIYLTSQRFDIEIIWLERHRADYIRFLGLVCKENKPYVVYFDLLRFDLMMHCV